MKKVFIKETNSVFVTTKSDLEISISVFVFQMNLKYVFMEKVCLSI